MGKFDALTNIPVELRNALETEANAPDSEPITDDSAIHNDVDGELAELTEKGVPVAADLLIIEDSADSSSKKKVQISNLPGGTDADAIHDNVDGEVAAVAVKGVPVVGDIILIEDSAAANAKKSITLGTIPGLADTIHDNVAGEIDAIAAKAVPTVADQMLIEDAAAANAKKKVVIANFPKIAILDGDTIVENGFENKTDSVMSFVDGTRTFTIDVAVATFTFWSNTNKFTKSGAEDLIIGDVEGIHYIYYNSAGALAETTTFNDSLIIDEALITIIYWDATNNEAIMRNEERHGRSMGSATHVHLHHTLGTLYDGGLGLGDFTADGSGALAAHATFSVDDGEIHDEDNEYDIVGGSPQTLAPTAQIPMFYRDGASGEWRRITATDYPVTTTGTGRAAWNEWTGATWQLTEVTSNQYVLTHIFATCDVVHPMIGIVGQSSYPTQAAARAGAQTELASLVIGNLSGLAVEFIPIGSVIYQTSNAYGNAVKSRIRTTDTGDDYVDFRASGVGGGAGFTTNDHAALSGLTGDDHPAYINSTQAATQYYVDGTAGSDLNDGLSWGAAKATLQGMFDIIPLNVRHNITINCRNTITETTDAVLDVTLYENVFFVIDGGDDLSVINDNGGGDFTADINTTQSIGETGAGWTPGDYYGYMVEITSGGMAGEVRTIRNNTADTLIPTTDFSAAPTGLDFRIMEPDTVVTDAAGGFEFYINPKGFGTYVIQRMTFKGEFYTYIRQGDSTPVVHLASLVYDLDAATIASIYSVSEASVWSFPLTRDPATYAFLGGNYKGGIGVLDNTTEISFINAGEMFLYGVVTKSFIEFVNSTIRGIDNGNNFQLGCIVRDCRTNLGFTSSPGYTDTLITNSGGNGVDIIGGNVNMDSDTLDISDCSAHGIEVTRNGILQITDTVAGTGNTGHGVAVSNGGRVTTAAGITPTLTGGAGDVQNNGATEAWAANTSYGPVYLDEITEGGAGTDTTAVHDNVSAEISAVSEKATPVDADLLLIEDSADTNSKKKIQIGNLPGGGSVADNLPMLDWSSVSVIDVVSKPGKSGSLIATLNDGVQYTATSPLTMDMAVSGLGGIEASDSETNDQWFYLYLVPDGSDFDVISTRNDPESGPDDYAIWKYIGAVRNNNASNLENFYQDGNYFQRDGQITIGNLSKTGSWVGPGIDDFVPRSCGSVYLQGSVTSTTASHTLYVRTWNSPSGVGSAWCGAESSFTARIVTPEVGDKSIHYVAIAGSDTFIYIIGWYDSYI